MSIHERAVVEPGAEIGDNVEIGPYSIIGPDVKIGAGTKVLSHVVITGSTVIGTDNVFHPGSVVGGDPQDLKFEGEDSRVEIGDNNTIREFVTVNKGTSFGGWETRIGSDNLIMAYCHIAHDCILGDSIIMGNAATLGGHVSIESNAVISGLVGLHHFVTVGEYAFIGGASKAVADVPPYMMGDGHPLKIRNINQVKLERSGFPEDSIKKIRRIYKLIYKDRENVSALHAEISPGHELYCEEVMHIFDFMERTEKGRYGRAKEADRTDT